MFKKLLLVAILIVLIPLITLFVQKNSTSKNTIEEIQESLDEGGLSDKFNPLSINELKNGDFPGSDFVIEQTLEKGSNYDRYIASYKSEGLKIYGLLTIPSGQKPKNGWPAIIFNHGYIPPLEYKTTEKYVTYLDGFARNDYVVFKSDYRGHGNSEGNPSGSYGSNSYTIDVLNGMASVKKLKDFKTGEQIVDVNNLGMWGHSMGGHITLRSMVTQKEIKAGVIWAGVVVSYPDLITKWRRNRPTPTLSQTARGWRQQLMATFGDPETNPEFWNSISANSYLSEISGPVQLHHGTADTSVPLEFSQTLSQQLKTAGKTVELYTYPGDDHNIAGNFGTAIQRSIDFFDKYLKGGEKNE